MPAPMAIMMAERVRELHPSFLVYPFLGGGVTLKNETCEVEIHNDLYVCILRGEEEIELDTPSPEEISAALKAM